MGVCVHIVVCHFLQVYPLDMARTRMAADLTIRGQATQNRNLVHCLKIVLQHGGVSALYHGISASLLGVCVYRCALLSTSASVFKFK